MGFDLIQQRVLFWPEEAPQAEAVAHAIDARDATALDRCLRANGELTLGLLDWAMRQAHEAQDALMLEWCLEQDRLLRGHVGGKQEFGDAYAARLAWRRGVLRPVIGVLCAWWRSAGDFALGDVGRQADAPRITRPCMIRPPSGSHVAIVITQSGCRGRPAA